MKKIIRVVYYIRVSTQEQKLKGLSLDAQRMKLDEYAKKQGYKFIRSYEDQGISGRKLIKKRPALQQLLKDAKNNEFDLIIFIKLDRYFRSVAEYHECQKILDTYNIKWEATEEKYDITTANGRAFVNMKLTIAEFEADQGGERIKLVNEYKVKEGYALSGAVPFGWKLKREGNHSIVVRDPEVENIVYEALDHLEFISKSVMRTIFYIYDKYDLPFTYKVLRNTLSNTFLYGYYRNNPNYCESYCDQERYDRLQKIINKNIREYKTRRIYLFSNLVTCSCCGTRMTGTYIQGSHGQEYLAYKCNHKMKKVKCVDNTRIYESVLERYILEHLSEELEKFIIETELNKPPENNKKNVDVKKIKKEMERLNFMFQKNRISIEKYDLEYETLEKKLKEAELNESNKEIDLKPLKQLLETDFKSIYDLLDREHKRSFWQSILKEIVITKVIVPGQRFADKKIEFSFNPQFIFK